MKAENVVQAAPRVVHVVDLNQATVSGWDSRTLCGEAATNGLVWTTVSGSVTCEACKVASVERALFRRTPQP